MGNNQLPALEHCSLQHSARISSKLILFSSISS